MTSPKIYLITGANRGLGRGLVEALIQRPNTTVIAGVRDPNEASSQSLSTLPTAPGSKVITIAIDNTDASKTAKSISTLEPQYGITKLDVVIANAGISKYYGPAATTPIAEVRDHFEVNALGSLILFQETWPLLKASSAPMFVALSTAVGSIGESMASLPLPATAYGSSKAALNYIVRKIHFENPELTAFALVPGWVQTEMGNLGARSSGMEEAPVTLKDSIHGMLSKIDGATREKTSGTFQSFDDTEYTW
ncbi:aflatoxin biosynthesis ketoreductase-like protein nor-1 [Cadophora sp. MPI-SDFR-AT-0126]|nr:aflatoxin biosynthesis ketoreductase-like protein nor-1 [Leotiomycetes sp. MPI-SDFR-AT-0126]